jgi:glutathione-specific gamma-glutamylcyclotransferase
MTHVASVSHPDSSVASVNTLTIAERDASLSGMLADWNGRDPIWVFAYGSLIWHPEFSFDLQSCGVVYGFHRSLCLWSRVYRGTPEVPGLVLGLEPGGSCRGLALRIPAEIAREELTRLWTREMMTGSYIPRWLDVRTPGSNAPKRIRGIGFVMDRSAAHYAGELDRDTLVNTLCTARGQRGSSAEYLLATVECLEQHGISDRHLEGLAADVRRLLAAQALTACAAC